MSKFISGSAFSRQSDIANVGGWHVSLGLYSNWACTSSKLRNSAESLHAVVESFRPAELSVRHADFALDEFGRPRFVYIAGRKTTEDAWHLERFAGAYRVASSARRYLCSLGFLALAGRNRASAYEEVAGSASSLPIASVPSSGLMRLSADALSTASRVGMIMDVLSFDSDWADLPLNLVYRRIATPVALGQCAVLMDDRADPIGFASWAWIQPAYYQAGPIAPETWKAHQWFEGSLGLAVDMSVRNRSAECREKLLRLLPEAIARDFLGASACSQETHR